MSVTTSPLFAASISASNSSINAGTTSGSFALSKTDRKEAWSLAMETQQSENWLRHGLTAHEYFIGGNSQSYQFSSGNSPSFVATRSEKDVDSADNSKSVSEKKNGSPNRNRSISEFQQSREDMSLSSVDGRMSVNSEHLSDKFSEGKPEANIASLNNELVKPPNELVSSNKYLVTPPTHDFSIERSGGLKPYPDQKMSQELSTNLTQLTAIGRSDLVSGLLSAEQFEGKVVSDFLGTSNLDRVSMSTIDNRDLKNGLQSIDARLLSIDGNEENVEESSSDAQAKFALSEKNMASPNSQERMSFHTEISELGVRIWLGVNERTHGDVANLISHLRTWLMTQGVPLLSLVCNGKAIREVGPSESGSEGQVENARLKNSSAIEFPVNIATDHYVKMAEELALIKF